jgi:dTDP-4-amino-4,6-dideoxygalactose transaminase
MVTNGRLVRELEERVAEKFGVAHCVAVASCTLGLALLIQALDPGGPVQIPSFTFSATAHAARWNACTIAFADCRPDTWCLGSDDIRDKPALIVGVHVSGVPCDIKALSDRAKLIGADLIFDSAHGAGSTATIDGVSHRLGGFGRAEVFSLTPTKVLSSAEGGLITTNDESLADHLRIAREYGNPGDYDTRFAGLNARLSELHAALALQSLDHLDERVRHRNTLADRYHETIASVPGIAFQQVPSGAVSSYKDFTILIDQDVFGCSRDAVGAALGREGIDTRKYYSPPVHRQTAYADVQTPDLPVTDALAEQVVSLPMWSHMPFEHAERIGVALQRIQQNAAAVEAAITD